MKLIFVTREGYDLAGARIRCYNFARVLKKHGLDTEVLSFADTLGAKSGKEECKLRIRDKLKYNLEAFQKLKRERNVILFLNRFHYHSFAPWFLHLINGNRLVFDLDDWEMRENPEYYLGFWPSSKAEFLIRKIARTADSCIAASRFLQDFLGRFNSEVCYVPSGVDTDLFRPREKKRDSAKIILSWIGTMHRRDDIENIEFIIDCFRQLNGKHHDIFLEIVGDGIYSGVLNQILEEYNDDNISLKGWIPPEHMPDYLSGIDIGLVPLIQETKFNMAKSPTNLFEYMAMAKPTISSKIGEITRIVQDGENGFLATDKEKFIEKARVLINSEFLREEMGNEAKRTVELNYSLDILGRRLFEILKTA